MLPEEIEQQLNSNPHVLQMIEEIAKNPDLLARVENGDESALQEASDLAKEHFLCMSLGIVEGRQRDDIRKTIVQEMSERVYNRIRQES